MNKILLLFLLSSSIAMGYDINTNLKVTGSISGQKVLLTGTGGNGNVSFKHQTVDATTPGSGILDVKVFAKSGVLWSATDDGSGTVVLSPMLNASTGTAGQVLTSGGGTSQYWALPNAGSLTGTVAIVNGGTAASTASGARTNIELGGNNDVSFGGLTLLKNNGTGFIHFTKQEYEPEGAASGTLGLRLYNYNGSLYYNERHPSTNATIARQIVHSGNAMTNPFSSTPGNGGEIIYSGDGGTVNALASGTGGQILVSNGHSAPYWDNKYVASGTVGFINNLSTNSTGNPIKGRINGGTADPLTVGGSYGSSYATTVPASGTRGDVATMTVTAGSYLAWGTASVQSGSDTGGVNTVVLSLITVTGNSGTGENRGVNSYHSMGAIPTGAPIYTVQTPVVRLTSDGTDITIPDATGLSGNILRLKLYPGTYTGSAPTVQGVLTLIRTN